MGQLEYLAHPPSIFPITKIIIPEVISYRSSGSIPVFEVRKKDCGVLMLDLVFQAGRPQEQAKMIAAACGSLLREGAGIYSSEILSEEVDFLGASLTTRASLDFIALKAVCLRKHFSKILEIIGAVLSDPHFSKLELEHYKDKSIERLKVQLVKTDILSYRIITEAMYGKDHPYGYNSSLELYQTITTDAIRQHYEDYLTVSNCQLFIAGDIRDEDRKLVDKLCACVRTGGKTAKSKKLEREETIPQNLIFETESNQTSIRMGRMACTRHNPDFDGLNYLCNVLGGYFGSRLVSHLREEKGLTYSIYCSVDTQLYDGDITISTDVANHNVKVCLEEIYKEMEDLKNELISEEELQLVNNYMMGNYLNLFDGPFNSIRAIKSLALADIPLDDLESLIKSSLSFESYQVRDMARKYFNRNDFWEVIVGTPQE